ncbi:sugar phosphate isomerase/epimerase family protein [Paenibacillus mendelii]|uniref:Sugar phosphate isomerase/epimerase family protein n=1 Tax=Paenibacillus mendelii TaxID=206163 RepID=A0ABV6JE97_9BACL|nr:TIM barrel protein [Paenibacillus mendelii]MCQ6563836.1 sugar phosphate isomerase/epimerase [Paenibacillus mendelii]
MKLGMPTLVEYTSITDNVQLCHTLGLNFIELNMNLPICIPENLSYKEIRYYKDQYGIDFTIHLPEELDVSSYHPSIRNGHLERCRQTMEWALLSGITTLNMHLNNGIYFTLPQTKVWINEQYESTFLELLSESYEELYRFAEMYEVQLCIENTGNFHIPYIRKALDKLSDFHNFYLTWDVGHDARADFQDEPTFTHYKNRIRHMHLHDYNGKSDHQPLYTGIVQINESLDFAQKNDLSVVIEVKTSESLVESVAELRKHGFLDMSSTT